MIGDGLLQEYQRLELMRLLEQAVAGRGEDMLARETNDIPTVADRLIKSGQVLIVPSTEKATLKQILRSEGGR